MLYAVYCNNVPILTQHKTCIVQYIETDCPVYRNSPYRVVRPWSINNLRQAIHSDLMTGCRHIEIRTNYANEV